ncbi:hypothetical protein PR048_006282 [Dryococelus australis]|uniref:Uncharacterized protein n=1 Tax=Dryococelus australis TaxID=614101 RepID=A0ABQ9IAK2_9NEOP|nr:hypothetical protein PR048_006282 [Dryococelus australis]
MHGGVSALCDGGGCGGKIYKLLPFVTHLEKVSVTKEKGWGRKALRFAALSIGAVKKYLEGYDRAPTGLHLEDRMTMYSSLGALLPLAGRGGRAICPLTSHQGEPGSILGRVTELSQVGIVQDDDASRRVLSGISRFPAPSFRRLSAFTYRFEEPAQISSFTPSLRSLHTHTHTHTHPTLQCSLYRNHGLQFYDSNLSTQFSSPLTQGTRGGVVVRLLASHHGEPCSILGGVAPVFSHVGIVSNDAAGSAGFLGDLPYPTPLHSGAAPYSPHLTPIGSQEYGVKSQSLCPIPSKPRVRGPGDQSLVYPRLSIFCIDSSWRQLPTFMHIGSKLLMTTPCNPSPTELVRLHDANPPDALPPLRTGLCPEEHVPYHPYS